MAFRARKVFGSLEKRTPGLKKPVQRRSLKPTKWDSNLDCVDVIKSLSEAKQKQYPNHIVINVVLRFSKDTLRQLIRRRVQWTGIARKSWKIVRSQFYYHVLFSFLFFFLFCYQSFLESLLTLLFLITRLSQTSDARGGEGEEREGNNHASLFLTFFELVPMTCNFNCYQGIIITCCIFYYFIPHTFHEMISDAIWAFTAFF